MTESRLHYPILIWAGWLLFCLFLRSGPASFPGGIQAGMRESTGALLSFVQSVLGQEVATGKSRTVAELSADGVVPHLQAENRELVRLVADLRKENKQLREAVPVQEVRSRPLLSIQAIPTRIIGRRHNTLNDRLELLISLEKQAGMKAAELVFSGPGLLIDQGTSLGLAPDQLLTAGRGLFGQTIQAGSHTALVMPITDPKFRMAVRIVRRSKLGAVQGPRGILAGVGTGCRLDEIPATEAVAIGDEVYTDVLVSPGSGPIYCGRVTRAEVAPTDLHWSIDVAPLHGPESLPSKLYVLRTELNSERFEPPSTQSEASAVNGL